MMIIALAQPTDYAGFLSQQSHEAEKSGVMMTWRAHWPGVRGQAWGPSPPTNTPQNLRQQISVSTGRAQEDIRRYSEEKLLV